MESPLVLLDLDRRSPPPLPAGGIVVAVAAAPVPAEPRCDVLLTAAAEAPRPWVTCADPWITAKELAEAVGRQPAAAVALVQVLRMGERLTPPDRLVAESLAYSMLQAGAGFQRWLATAPRRTARPAEEPV